VVSCCHRAADGALADHHVKGQGCHSKPKPSDWPPRMAPNTKGNSRGLAADSRRYSGARSLLETECSNRGGTKLRSLGGFLGDQRALILADLRRSRLCQPITRPRQWWSPDPRHRHKKIAGDPLQGPEPLAVLSQRVFPAWQGFAVPPGRPQQDRAAESGALFLAPQRIAAGPHRPAPAGGGDGSRGGGQAALSASKGVAGAERSCSRGQFTR